MRAWRVRSVENKLPGEEKNDDKSSQDQNKCLELNQLVE